MRRKQWAIICVVIFALTACAFSPADVEESSEAIAGAEESKQEESKEEEEPVTEQGTEKEKVSSDDDTADSQSEICSREEDIRAQELYETFANLEFAGFENYAYVIYDGDGDGYRELYIKRGNSGSFYVITCVKGGLLIEYQKEIPSEVSGLQWVDMETLTVVQNEEMVHSGIYVYAEQGNSSESFWYPNENDFVAANGFGGVEPFFEYFVPDGSKRLTFYYDEATQKGCGIRYYERDPSTFTTTGMYGFVFEGLEESKGSGVREDYLKPQAVDGTDGSGEVEDFKENTEYDDKGRLTHYDATGILTFLKESNMEPEPVLWIDYDYYDNGNLKSRFYWHNGYIFGTWYTTWSCYFDEQGRIAHEDIYITHGSWDTYYIYMDDTKKPAYILDLDDNMGTWIPEFRKGT